MRSSLVHIQTAFFVPDYRTARSVQAAMLLSAMYRGNTGAKEALQTEYMLRSAGLFEILRRLSWNYFRISSQVMSMPAPTLAEYRSV